MSSIGAYLSGRIAQEDEDLPAALAFYQEALAHTPNDPELTMRLFVVAVSTGRFDLARPLADRVVAADPTVALANLVQAVEGVRQNRPRDGLAAARRLPDDGFYRFVGAFARAWLTLADKGGMPAVTELHALDSEPVFAPLVALNAALIEDIGGDMAAAERDYRAALGDRPPSLRLAQLAGNFFERIGKPDEATRLYQAFAQNGGSDTGIVLGPASGRKPAPLVADARAGFAESLFDLGSVVNQADSPEVATLNIRLALELEPDDPLATLLLGDIFDGENRPLAALAAYRSIDPASTFGWAARLRAAAANGEAGDTAGAEHALRAMAAERPAEAEPLVELGNILRSHDQYKEAASVYTEALTRLGPAAHAWTLYYSRGVALERQGDWTAAEADLRKALILQPDQADVLNYLGYSLVDRGERLPEALTLIKRAAALRPKDGFIVDSLGWAYFRLGNFKDAESTLEQAVELRPGDAEINDHLGDAYWQGGRREEARLQWRRALSLKPEAGVAKAIEAKLDHPPTQRRATAAGRAD
jgi:tetratricopeptide (TPR) repeat protein